jgi:hypothetical protein
MQCATETPVEETQPAEVLLDEVRGTFRHETEGPEKGKSYAMDVGYLATFQAGFPEPYLDQIWITWVAVREVTTTEFLPGQPITLVVPKRSLGDLPTWDEPGAIIAAWLQQMGHLDLGELRDSAHSAAEQLWWETFGREKELLAAEPSAA